MSDFSASTRLKDEFRCVGNFNPEDSFCYRECVLSLRCVIEYNRQARLEKYMDILDMEDMWPVDLH